MIKDIMERAFVCDNCGTYILRRDLETSVFEWKNTDEHVLKMLHVRHKWRSTTGPV